jgi:hypothetical protein
MNFLRLAEVAGWKTIFMVPTIPNEKIIQPSLQEKADLVRIFYRLIPETGECLLGEFAEVADELRCTGVPLREWENSEARE